MEAMVDNYTFRCFWSCARIFIFVELKVVVGYGGPHLSLGCESMITQHINKPRWWSSVIPEKRSGMISSRCNWLQPRREARYVEPSCLDMYLNNLRFADGLHPISVCVWVCVFFNVKLGLIILNDSRIWLIWIRHKSDM